MKLPNFRVVEVRYASSEYENETILDLENENGQVSNVVFVEATVGIVLLNFQKRCSTYLVFKPDLEGILKNIEFVYGRDK